MDYKTALLKSTILEKFKSIREFASACEIPYTTIKSALDKGIGGTSVENVIKMCDALDLDISKLQEKKAPIPADAETEAFDKNERKLLHNYRQLNQEGQEKLLDYADDLVMVGRYTKNNQLKVPQEA